MTEREEETALNQMLIVTNTIEEMKKTILAVHWDPMMPFLLKQQKLKELRASLRDTMTFACDLMKVYEKHKRKAA